MPGACGRLRATSVNTHTDRHDVIVVGGGQAGLAIGHFLARQGRRFTILEASSQPAAAWRARWDSLRLFTPVRYSSLPGLRLPGRPGRVSGPRRGGGLPHGLRPALRPAGGAEQPRARGPPDATTGTWSRPTGRTYEADQVVVATGPFQEPLVPPIADGPRPRRRSAAQQRLPLAATTSRRARCWWWEAGTPASRSPPSWRARTRCTCRSARARRPSPSASSAATSSGTSWPPD